MTLEILINIGKQSWWWSVIVKYWNMKRTNKTWKMCSHFLFIFKASVFFPIFWEGCYFVFFCHFFFPPLQFSITHQLCQCVALLAATATFTLLLDLWPEEERQNTAGCSGATAGSGSSQLVSSALRMLLKMWCWFSLLRSFFVTRNYSFELIKKSQNQTLKSTKYPDWLGAFPFTQNLNIAKKTGYGKQVILDKPLKCGWRILKLPEVVFLMNP